MKRAPWYSWPITLFLLATAWCPKIRAQVVVDHPVPAVSTEIVVQLGQAWLHRTTGLVACLYGEIKTHPNFGRYLDIDNAVITRDPERDCPSARIVGGLEFKERLNDKECDMTAIWYRLMLNSRPDLVMFGAVHDTTSTVDRERGIVLAPKVCWVIRRPEPQTTGPRRPIGEPS